MTNAELKALATRKKKAETTEKKKGKGGEPSTVLEISKEYIKAFYKTANTEDRYWIKERIAVLTDENDDAVYFSKFKMEFAERFLPNIIKKEKPAKKSLLDELCEFDDEEKSERK